MESGGLVVVDCSHVTFAVLEHANGQDLGIQACC